MWPDCLTKWLRNEFRKINRWKNVHLQEKKARECNKDQIRTWGKMQIMSLISQPVPKNTWLDKRSLTSQSPLIRGRFSETQFRKLWPVAESIVWNGMWKLLWSHTSHITHQLWALCQLRSSFWRDSHHALRRESFQEIYDVMLTVPRLHKPKKHLSQCVYCI